MNDRWDAVRTRLHPEFAGRLVARGKARNIIWREGQIPRGARQFSARLTDDLLNYAFSLLSSGLDAREAGEHEIAQRCFATAAESIESVVRDGSPEDPRRGFFACVAAASYAIARFNARAFNMIDTAHANLSPAEEVFRLLILRDLAGLRRHARERLGELFEADRSGTLAERDIEDIQADSLTFNYLLAIGSLVTYLARGDLEHLARARARLDDGERAAMRFGFVESWWLQKLSRLMLDDFERFSYHTVLPPRPDVPKLSQLRRKYINEITGRARAQVDLWPSQVDAAQRAFNDQDDLVVALPTSGGKTRIAEIAMLPVLASGGRVLYVTPLRALCAHVERVLRETFEPIGFSVSTLYDASTIGEYGFVTDITVVTPERLDFALRRDPAAIEAVELIVLDEGHMIGVNAREIRYEQLIDRLVRLARTRACRFVCLSALLPEGEEFCRFVSWIRDDEEGEPARSEWRPTRQRFGTMVYRQDIGRLELDPGAEMTFIPEFVRSGVFRVDGRKRTFPTAQSWDWTLATAWRYLDRKESVLVYCPEKRSVNTGAGHITRLLGAGVLPAFPNPLTPVEEATLDEWMIRTDPIAICARAGVVVMHASIPKAVQHVLHSLLASHRARLILASPSVAQGLDLAASVVLFHSIYRSGKVIPVSEFINVAGRAGRAFVDIDGQIVFVSIAGANSLAKWRKLCVSGREMRLTSGIFQVVAQLFTAYNKTHPNMSADDARFIAEGGWRPTHGTEGFDVDAALQQIDDALLTIVEQDNVDPADAAVALDNVLHGTLLWRTLEARPERVRTLVASFLIRRAERLAEYTPAQRRAAYLGGIKLELTRDLETLVAELGPALVEVEGQLSGDDSRDAVIEQLLTFAERAFTFEHFRPRGGLPADWHRIAALWLRGLDVPSIGAGPEVLSFIEEALRYSLPLAVEVIRGVESRRPRMSAAAAFAYGSADTVALTLLADGLTSRRTAHALSKLLGGTVPPDTNALRLALAADRELILEMLEPPQAELFRRYIDRARSDFGGEAWEFVDRVPLSDGWQGREGDAWLFPDGTVSTADLLPFAIAGGVGKLAVPAGGIFGRVSAGEFHLDGPTPTLL